MSGTDVEAFVIATCHEMGHAFGGSPYLAKEVLLAAEGQADYFAGANCAHKILQGMSSTPPIRNDAAEVEAAKVLCQRAQVSRQGNICTSSLLGAQRLMFFISKKIKSNESVSLSVKSNDGVTERTILGYPSSQCRLDTFVAGYLGEPRPRCWFQPSDTAGPELNDGAPSLPRKEHRVVEYGDTSLKIPKLLGRVLMGGLKKTQ